jgi:REP element-mobilizing transposase RayT
MASVKITNELPVRKHPRLESYDYSKNGAYFITFCVKNKQCLLGNVVRCPSLGVPHVELTELGETVLNEIQDTHIYYDNVLVDKFVVMPNHVHMIIHISEDDGASKRRALKAFNPANALIPRIVTMIKKKTNKALGYDIWQRSFYDHVIRNDSGYMQIWQYIDDNPAKWSEDDYYIPSDQTF